MGEEVDHDLFGELLAELGEEKKYTMKPKQKRLLDEPFVSFQCGERIERYIREDKVGQLIQRVREESGQEIAKLQKELEDTHEQHASEINELKDTCEQSVSVIKETKQAFEKLQRESSENYQTLAKTVFEAINHLDQMIVAFSEANELVAKQLESVATIIVQQLAMIGIVEVPSYGKEVDGDYMESLGVISRDEVEDDELKAHEVARVLRRAFKDEKTGKILQYSLVETVEEEA